MRPKGILCLRLRTAYSGFRYSLLAHTYIFLSCKSSHEQRNLGRKKRKREKKIMRIKEIQGRRVKNTLSWDKKVNLEKILRTKR